MGTFTLVICTHNRFLSPLLHSNIFPMVRTYCTCFQRPVHSNILRKTVFQIWQDHAPWRSLHMLERLSSCHSNRYYFESFLGATGGRGEYYLYNNQVNCTQLKRKLYQINKLTDVKFVC